MNWLAMTAVCAMLSLCVTVFGFAYLAGQFREKVRGLRVDFNAQAAHIAEHDKWLGRHEVRLTKQETWREGYSAGMRAGSSNV